MQSAPDSLHGTIGTLARLRLGMVLEHDERRGADVPSGKPEPTADASHLVSIPVVGGLHHRYIRVAA